MPYNPCCVMFGLCILTPTHWLVPIKAAERKCLLSATTSSFPTLWSSCALKLLLRPCNVYCKCSLNCSVRAFANHGQCWPNGLQHVMINYGCSPSLRACGYAAKAWKHFATLPSLLPLLVQTFVHFPDSHN